MFWFFVLLLMLAPLPFGMVHALFQALFACLLLALMAGFSLSRAAAGAVPALPLRRIAPEVLGFGLTLSWVLIQLLPITPQAWHHPLWTEAGTALGTELAGSISLTPGAGFVALMRLFTYGAVFWLALQWGRDRKRARQILGAVILAGTLYAIYGLVIHFAGLRMILWVDVSHMQNLSGTFVNRNNFATYLGLALLAVVGLYLAGLHNALDSGRRGRDRLIHLVQQAAVRSAPQLACLLTLLVALLLTNSRAGVTSTLIGLLTMLLLYGPLLRIYRAGYLATAGTVLFAAVAVFMLSGDGFLTRLLATDLEREQRLMVYEQTWRAISDAPWTGFGAGGFEQVFPIYADLRLSSYDKAHNDWLETVFNLGWPAALLWFAVLVGLALRCLMGIFRRQRDQVYPLVGFCACLLVALHATVDFSLQIPAVAITFAALLGVGVAQSWSSGDKGAGGKG